MQRNKPGIVHDTNSRWTGSGANYLLWTVQTLLAALFLFAGGMKLVLPIEAMTRQILLPGWFLRFIGIAEVLGGLGLMLPWMLDIKRVLTPLAASGLVIIMSGATILSFESGSVRGAVIPFVVGIFSALVAYGRWITLSKYQVLNATLTCLGKRSLIGSRQFQNNVRDTTVTRSTSN